VIDFREAEVFKGEFAQIFHGSIEGDLAGFHGGEELAGVSFVRGG
jgi:hypothetical protein